MRKHTSLILLFFLFISCKTDYKKPDLKDNDRGVITKKAMVVSARAEASKIGVSILQAGGNVFDAMIATELALAVAYPYAGNLGGGGFMVYRINSGEIGALDYREKAPLAAHRDMYLDSLGEIVPKKSTLGAMAIGVPGTVAGVFAVHEKFGSLPIEDIMQPVIDLANKGVVVTKKQAKSIKKYQKAFPLVNKEVIPFDYAWKENDTIKYLALAKTLEQIMNNGPDAFYNGEIAHKIVDFIQQNGGIITKEDLANYEAKWRQPITFNYDDLRIISMSPPSSGGICLGQLMKMVEPYNLHKLEHNSVEAIQLIVEAERRAYADRSFYLGDPDFVDIPIETLMDSKYLKNRMQDFTWEKASSSDSVSYGDVSIYESNETTHYSIVDQFGNAIAATTTLNGAYGSKLYSNELGFFFNNEMDDFSSKPGLPNMFGLIGGEANSIAPEKRMLSSMTPTLIEKEGELWMTLGTPGGSKIITSVFQTILNVHEYNMTMQEAVDAPRFHHQWLPDEILIEPNSFPEETLNTLHELGYTTNEKRSLIIGKVDGILVLPNGNLEGGADHRGDDAAHGF